ncbi:UNVERIFIED_CONTAM: hypothetical protein EX528_14250 [Xanthomonas axonopodis]
MCLALQSRSRSRRHSRCQSLDRLNSFCRWAWLACDRCDRALIFKIGVGKSLSWPRHGCFSGDRTHGVEKIALRLLRR